MRALKIKKREREFFIKERRKLQVHTQQDSANP